MGAVASGALQADDIALPLKVAPAARFLIDQNGKPVFLQGDTAWSLIVALTKEEAAHYLNDRATKGFNALIVNLVEHKYGGPADREGNQPFLKEGDLSAPNEKYFAHADWVLRQASEKGFVVLLAPMYLGYKGSDEGWHQEVRLNGEARCRDYGRYLGKRYRNFKNIVWTIGGDRNPADVRDEVEALAAGLREQTPTFLFTAHTAPETTPFRQYGLNPWLDINATYSYNIVHRHLLENYHQKPVMPNILIETTYEGEHNASPLQIRRQAYWALLSGACGQFYGNRPIWGFFPGWQKELDGHGGRDMAILSKFVKFIPWNELEPDDKHEIVTKGLGEFRGLDYLSAAISADGKRLVAYIPTPRSFAVDLSRIKGGKLRAEWFDPTTGNRTPAGEFEPNAVKEFHSPGTSDSVLLVEAAGPANPPKSRP